MAYVPDSLSAPSAGTRRAIPGRSVLAPLGAVVVFLILWEALVWPPTRDTGSCSS